MYCTHREYNEAIRTAQKKAYLDVILTGDAAAIVALIVAVLPTLFARTI